MAENSQENHVCVFDVHRSLCRSLSLLFPLCLGIEWCGNACELKMVFGHNGTSRRTRD